jgi:tripartite-type tricarboxylate transporter receptor subunit TctC
MRLVRTVAFAISLFAPVVAAADPVADFYAGKQMSFIIRAAPGGNYDLYLRALARHMMRHIPGNPTAVPMNLPGGGGLTALNYFDKVAPQDGTAITMVTQTAPMDQVLGLDKNIKTDMGKLSWLGNMSDENLFLVTNRNAATKTIDDAKVRETPVAATGAGGTEGIMASIMNAVLATKLKNIFGYRSGPEMTLALQRGEAEARWTTNLRSLFAGSPGGAADFNVVVQIGLKADPSFPGVPLLRALGGNANDTVVLDFISRVMALARPVATTAATPPDRIAALRQAFDTTMKDPEFLADAKQQDLNISPWTGSELQKVVADILATPEPVRERIKQAVQSDASQRR